MGPLMWGTDGNRLSCILICISLKINQSAETKFSLFLNFAEVSGVSLSQVGWKEVMSLFRSVVKYRTNGLILHVVHSETQYQLVNNLTY